MELKHVNLIPNMKWIIKFFVEQNILIIFLSSLPPHWIFTSFSRTSTLVYNPPGGGLISVYKYFHLFQLRKEEDECMYLSTNIISRES